MKASLNTESCRVNVAIFERRIEIIQEVVANHYGISLEQTKEHHRLGSSIKARQKIHYFSHVLLPACPLAVIGLLTGNGEAFDHSTILHGAKKVATELKMKNRAGLLVYPEVLAEITLLREKILNRFDDARSEPTVKRCPTCGQVIQY